MKKSCPDGEMADATDLKSVGEILAGSSPAQGILF